jgi:hypothetical protein
MVDFIASSTLVNDHSTARKGSETETETCQGNSLAVPYSDGDGDGGQAFALTRTGQGGGATGKRLCAPGDFQTWLTDSLRNWIPTTSGADGVTPRQGLAHAGDHCRAARV